MQNNIVHNMSSPLSDLKSFKLQNDGLLLDILSAIDFKENEHSSTQKSKKSNLLSLQKLNTNYKKINNNTSKGKLSFPDFSFSSEFPSMLLNLHENSISNDKNSDDDISMLDLLKLVNIDSDSLLSGYLNVSKEPNTEEIKKILDSCQNTSRPVKNINIESECCIKPIIASSSRINKFQSLFAKALSCKPRKKVENKTFFIKSNLYNLYFNKKVLDVKNDTETVVCKHNTGIITLNGRRYFP